MKRLVWGIGAALLPVTAVSAHELDQIHAHVGGVVVFGVPFWVWAAMGAAIAVSGGLLAMKRRTGEAKQTARRGERHDSR
ncbi:MAG: hypothetical protein KDJ19_11790 [Hyphomicrobiaceae bacterium]|nr:hypothetical protein [Hyphomicrobiaceae bacterium]MCC0023379.1 hypothetical protein [Hyphomicrobiaceae bacterium]